MPSIFFSKLQLITVLLLIWDSYMSRSAKFVSQNLWVSNIVNEDIRTIYLFFFFFIKIFCIKRTHKLCLNILIRLKSIIKHTSNFYITPRSIIKHTSNFHLNITPRSIKRKKNFSSKYFYTLKKAHKQFSFRYYA